MQDRSHLLTHVISRLVPIDNEGSWRRCKETMRRFLDRRLRFRRASVATRRFHDHRHGLPMKMPQCRGYFAAPLCLNFHRRSSTSNDRRGPGSASRRACIASARSAPSPKHEIARFRGRSLVELRRTQSANPPYELRASPIIQPARPAPSARRLPR